MTTDVVASLMLAVNHFQGRIADEDEQRVVGRAGAARMTATKIDVDDHLEQRVEDPPDVAEERVGALLLDVRLDEVADQPAARQDLVDALANQRKGPGLAAE